MPIFSLTHHDGLTVKGCQKFSKCSHGFHRCAVTETTETIEMQLMFSSRPPTNQTLLRCKTGTVFPNNADTAQKNNDWCQIGLYVSLTWERRSRSRCLTWLTLVDPAPCCTRTRSVCSVFPSFLSFQGATPCQGQLASLSLLILQQRALSLPPSRSLLFHVL